MESLKRISAKTKNRNLTLLAGIALIGTAIFIVMLSPNREAESKMSVARIGLSSNVDTLEIDPAKIDNLTKALLCDNLYARLVRDDDGTITAWLAKKFTVSKNIINIELGSHFTASGKPITASDVETTLKRLLILNSNSHAKLSKFIACEKQIRKLSDKCDAIEVTNNSIKIIAASPTKAQMLLKIFAATEYGIVPTDSIDANTLKIINYGSTTGAYYFNNIKSDGLIKNKHFKSESKYFDVIKISHINSSDSIVDLFLKNEIDIIPTTVNLNSKSAKKLLQSGEINIFYTDKIKLFMINFGPEMISKFSAAERHFYILKVRELMLASFPFPLEAEPALQFLSTNGTGRLHESQLMQLNSLIADSVNHQPKDTFGLYSYRGLEKTMAMLAKIPNISLTFGDNFPPEDKFEDRPDSYYMMGDISFDEDYTLLSYYLTNQLVAMNKDYVENILAKFLDTESADKRAEQLNKIHFEIMKNALVGPIAVAPYSIVTRKPFVSTQSRMSASTKLWLINAKNN